MPRTRASWVVSGYSAVALASCVMISCGPKPSPQPDHPGDPGDPSACEAAHGFSAKPLAPQLFAGTTCPPEGCGLNGVWMGRGVPFRTLHLSPGVPNKEGVSILGFRQGADDLQLEIDSNTDQLIGRSTSSGNRLTGPALIGAVITLGTGSPPVATYELTIRGFKQGFPQDGYWLRCPACGSGAAAVYTFEAIKLTGDRCAVRLCQPGLDDEPPAGLAGNAVIFRGDYYNERTHGVTTTPTTQNPGTGDGDPDAADDIFNIACVGTAISKLHLLRHTSASRTTASAAQRQALLKAITADYCGDGSAFTQDGHPIRFGFNRVTYSSAYTPEQSSHYSLSDAKTIEAAWAQDGARCIGTPRLTGETLSEINAACGKRRGTAPTTIPDCSPAVSLTTPFALGNDIVSANPNP